MFLLDTNVISELRRPEKANPAVLAWASRIPISEFYLSAITVLELEWGILRKERQDAAQGALLRVWFNKQVLPRFEGRILSVDQAVALCCAKLHVPDPRSERDALITATAIVHKLCIVTRNMADFAPMRVDVLNPWEA